MKVKSESEIAQWCLTLSDPMDCSPQDSPGKSTGVGCHFLLSILLLNAFFLWLLSYHMFGIFFFLL